MPQDPPRRSLVDAREVGRRDTHPGRERTELDELNERVKQMMDLLPDVEAMKRFIDQERAMRHYRATTPPGGMKKVETQVESESPPSLSPMGRAERMLKLAGPKAWIVLLVVGSICACGVYSKELAVIVGALMGTTPSAADDHAVLLKHTLEIDELKRADSSLRATDTAIITHQGTFQSDLSQVLSKLGAEWKMSGLDAPRPTLVDIDTKIQTGNKLGKGPIVVVKTPMPTPPKAPESKP